MAAPQSSASDLLLDHRSSECKKSVNAGTVEVLRSDSGDTEQHSTGTDKVSVSTSGQLSARNSPSFTDDEHRVDSQSQSIMCDKNKGQPGREATASSRAQTEFDRLMTSVSAATTGEDFLAQARKKNDDDFAQLLRSVASLGK